MKKDPKPDSELPEVESIGWTKVSNGYVVVWLTSQGNRITSSEVLTDPMPRVACNLELRKHFAARMLPMVVTEKS